MEFEPGHCARIGTNRYHAKLMPRRELIPNHLLGGEH